jgi:hypothetical protein
VLIAHKLGLWTTGFGGQDYGIMRFRAKDYGIMGLWDYGIMRIRAKDYGIMKVP